MTEDMIEVRATRIQLEEFKQSFIWQDILDEINRLDTLAQLEYDLVGEIRMDDRGFPVIPNSSETLIHLGDIKGRRKACENFKLIIDILIQYKDMAKEEREVSDE